MGARLPATSTMDIGLPGERESFVVRHLTTHGCTSGWEYRRALIRRDPDHVPLRGRFRERRVHT